MKKSRFTPTQIASILKEFDNGKTAEEINREHGVGKEHRYINGANVMEAWRPLS